MTALWPVQQAIYAKLTADTELATTEAGVLDEVPEAQDLPYVAFGELTEKPMDTHTSEGFEVMVVLNVWSGYKGNRQAAELLGHLRRILHRQPLDVAGWTLISIAQVADGVRKVSGNQTPNIRQGQMRLRVWVTRPV